MAAAQSSKWRVSCASFLYAALGIGEALGFDSVLDVRPQASPKTLRSDPGGYILQAKNLVELSDNLTERQKVIAEYWELSEGKGTNVILWNQFAQFVSKRDHYGLDDDIKLFFVLDNTMFDASIAAWYAKRYWDSERPQTAIATLARIFHGYMFHGGLAALPSDPTVSGLCFLAQRTQCSCGGSFDAFHRKRQIRFLIHQTSRGLGNGRRAGSRA